MSKPASRPELKPELKRELQPQSPDQPSERQWLVNDVTGLSRAVPEIDPSTYVDEQAEDAYEQALAKWPVMARLMGLR